MALWSCEECGDSLWRDDTVETEIVHVGPLAKTVMIARHVACGERARRGPRPPTPAELADLFRPEADEPAHYRLHVTDADRARMADATEKILAQVRAIEAQR